MARTLEDIFNECYERIRSGESLESCLKRYPQYAAALEPLLRTTFDIGRRASYIHPRPEFRHWALVRLEGEQNYARMQRQPAKPGHFSWRQSWAVAVAVVLVLLLAGGGTAAASSNAMPDEPLYPVKLATEEIRLTLAISDAQKAQIHTELAETRAAEVEAMADKGKLDEAAIAAERFAKELEQANLAMAKVESFTAGISVPTATPEPTITEPAQTETGTEEQQPTEVPPAQTETGTEEEQPAEVPPAQTETGTGEQPSTIEQPQTTPSDTKRDKWTARSERFKKTLDDSTSKSVEALQSAMEKAPPESKAHWQKSIDKIKEKSKEKQSDKDGTWKQGDWNKDKNKPKSQSDNTTRQGGTSTPNWQKRR